MSKIYVNYLNNKGILINEKDKTFKVSKATDLKQKGCLFYPVSLRRIIEIRNGLLERGFVRAWQFIFGKGKSCVESLLDIK